MKKLILLSGLICAITQTYCQINYEHTFVRSLSGVIGQEFYLTNLGNDNYKYVLYDYDSSKFSLYNLNYSSFMLNIPIPVVSDPSTSTYYKLGYITTDLFDCDSSTIEFAMMLNTPRPQKHPNFGVYRTDGTVLFTKDTVGTVFCIGCGSGSYEMHPIMNTPTGPKLFLFNNDSIPNENIFIYGLCGTLPTQKDELKDDFNFVKVYPNPSTNKVYFEIASSNHFDKSELTIFNSLFEVIKVIKIDESSEKINLNTEDFVSGIYLFTLKNRDSVIQTGKFVLTK